MCLMNEKKSLSRAERQKIQLRTDIIDTASAEFSERGYHQTSISDIAKRLGIGHGTFYRHFKNKRDILDHVIDDVSSKIAGTLLNENAPGAVNSLDDYREQCERISKQLANIVMDNPNAARLILLEATSIDPEMTQRIMGFFDWAAKLVSAYMEHGVKLGFFREDLDAEATGHVIVGLIMASALSFLRSPDDKAMQKRMADAVLRMLVDGIGV